jgi:nicotinamidase-related amidase
MKDYLIVVDMQTDFISGALGTKEALAILPRVKSVIEDFKGEIIYTRDTHGEDYLNTREGRNLPVRHCIKGSDGWQIASGLYKEGSKIFDKPTFGSVELVEYLALANEREEIGSVTLIGVCTDICVVSNAMLIKARFPEIEVIVDSSACAGVTPDTHNSALATMRMCQIIIK